MEPKNRSFGLLIPEIWLLLEKEQIERVHEFCSSAVIVAGTAYFLFPTWKYVPGGLFRGFWVKEWREVTFMKDWVKPNC